MKRAMLFTKTVSGQQIRRPETQGVSVCSVLCVCWSQFPWQKSPTIPHSHTLTVGSLWVSKYPVTNQQYFRFVNETGYKPIDDEHWLQHW